MLPPNEYPGASIRASSLIAALALLVAASLMGEGGGPAAAAQSVRLGKAGETPASAKTEAYLAQLRAQLPESWLEQEFERQRSFPALARSRQLVAAGQYDQAVGELNGYLATYPNDWVIEFEYLVLATNLKHYRAAIGAADRILAAIPDFAPTRYYRGLAWAALGKNTEALPDLAAAADSGVLVAADEQYARRSLAVAALASRNQQVAMTLLNREAAKPAAHAVFVLAKGQLLERLGRGAAAAAAYDDATRRTGDAIDIRAAWLFGAELALKRGDTAGALSRSQAAWKLAPGNPEVAIVLAESASRLGRSDLVETIERATKAAGTLDRGARESLANALFRVGRYGEAAARFDALAQSAASPAEEYRLRRAAGFAAQASKDYPRAFAELQRAADINPVPEALLATAEASLLVGRLDNAAAEFRRLAAATSGQAQADALTRLSVVEEQGGHNADALAALDQIAGDQRNADIERHSLFLATKLGERAVAVMYARRVTILEPTEANWRALGEAQIAAGQPGAAVNSLRRALALAPRDDPAVHEMLANALLAAGQPALAAKEFNALARQAKWPDDEYRFQLGAGFAALASGDPAHALAAFRQAQELDASAATAVPPADAYRLRLAGGFAALKANDTAGALAAFRQAVDLQATRESLEAAADASLQSGRLAEAAAYLERLAAADNGLLSSAPYLERLSVVYEKLGRTKQAAEALARLPKAAQTNPAVIRREAVLAQRLGDRISTLTHLRDLANAEPSDDNIAALAEAEVASGQTNAAAATFAALLVKRDLSAELRARYAEALGNIEAERRSPKRAEALFAQSYQFDPAHPPQRLAQAAESAIEAGDWQQAAGWYRVLVANQRITRTVRGGYAVRLGFALAKLKRDHDALAAYDAAARLGVTTPALHASRGAALMRVGRATAAVSEFRVAYDARPGPDLALSLAYAHQAAGQPGLAIVFLQRALSDREGLSPAQRQQAEAALGYAYSETDQYAQAAGHFEKALGVELGSSSVSIGGAATAAGQ